MRRRTFFYSIMLLGAAAICGTAYDASAQNPPFAIDDFKVYDVADIAVDESVTLRGVFDDEPKPATLPRLASFANPVSVDGDAVKDRNAHSKWYYLQQAEREPLRCVRVTNRFGRQRLTIGQPVYLLSPAELKAPGSGPPASLDYYKIYEVIQGKCTPKVNRHVDLRDDFVGERQRRVFLPRYVGVPVQMTHDGETFEIKNPDDYITVYDITRRPDFSGIVTAEDRFGNHELAIRYGILLSAPSRLDYIEPPQKLDYFKFYDIEDVAADSDNELITDFDGQRIDVHLDRLTHFGNPVRVNGSELIDPNAHLTWYRAQHGQIDEDADDEEDLDKLLQGFGVDPVRAVRVWNLFGEQILWLGSPKYVLLPAEKIEAGSGFPDELDEFKVYTVLRSCGTYRYQVDLEDQFGREERVSVGTPVVFAVPAEIDGDLDDIHNRKEFLTIYRITPRDYELDKEASDKLGNHDLKIRRSVMLGAPSLRFEVFPPLVTDKNDAN